MLVLVLGCAFLALVVPVAAWALASKGTLAGLTLAAALLTCGAGWFALIVRWVPPGQTANTVLALVVVTAALIAAGRLDRDAGILVPTGWPARFRPLTGPALSAACVCLSFVVGVALIFGSMFQVLQSYPYTPPSSDVLPLPPALAVVTDLNHGCCDREIDVRSTAGLSPDQTAQIVAGGLGRLHGWQLDQNGSACRYEGLLFGRQQVCVQLQETGHAVQVLLTSSIQ